jgi:hypothetical protein
MNKAPWPDSVAKGNLVFRFGKDMPEKVDQFGETRPILFDYTTTGNNGQ